MKTISQPIVDLSQCPQLLASMRQSSAIGIDTEFTRIKTYNPIPQLLQIATDEMVAVVDVAQCADLSALAALLREYQRDVVIHSTFQDMEILHLLQALPASIFDTQVAAQLCGLEHMSYRKLLDVLLGVKITKEMTRSDWNQRPLSDSQLGYALDDVRYLLPLYRKLSRQVESMQRTAWMREEQELLKQSFADSLSPDHAWIGFKGAERLSAADQHRVQALLFWREKRAQRLDRPRRWIMKDQHILQLVQSKPKTRAQLARLLALRPAKRRDWLDTVLTIVNSRPMPQANARLWQSAQRMTREQTRQTDLLYAKLIGLAQQLGVSETLLCSRSDCKAIVRGVGSSRLNRGWRREISRELIAKLES